VSISSILSSSPCCCLFFVDLPLHIEQNIYQRVLIRLNRSPNEGAMAISLQHYLLSRIWACATIGDSAISACRNLQLPCRLIGWSVDFMQLKIQIYLIVFCWGSCKHRDDIIILSSIDPEMYVWSSYWSLLGHHVMHPLAIVLDMVVSETYSLDKHPPKGISLKT
jgi:hypothetical protein